MNKENNEPWRDWEVEDWEHDIWKTRLHKFEFWNQTKEERAKGAYLQLIIEEGERGEYRKTWMEIIEERSAERKLMKKREKEEDKENEKSDEPGKCEEEESEMSTDKEERREEGGKEEGASLDPPLQPSGSPTFQPPDSPTFQPPDPPTDFDASIQKTNLNSFQVGVETQMGEESKSTQEKDGGLQMGDTGQMTEYYLKEEEVRRRTGKEEEEEEN